MMRGLIVGAMAMVALALTLDSTVEGGKEPASIKAVMKKVHVGGKKSVLSKVLDGSASSEERKTLVACYTELAKNKPPMGDADDWKAKTKALLDAAKANDTKALAKASNCAACHKAHKK